MGHLNTPIYSDHLIALLALLSLPSLPLPISTLPLPGPLAVRGYIYIYMLCACYHDVPLLTPSTHLPIPSPHKPSPRGPLAAKTRWRRCSFPVFLRPPLTDTLYIFLSLPPLNSSAPLPLGALLLSPSLPAKTVVLSLSPTLPCSYPSPVSRSLPSLPLLTGPSCRRRRWRRCSFPLYL